MCLRKSSLSSKTPVTCNTEHSPNPPSSPGETTSPEGSRRPSRRAWTSPTPRRRRPRSTPSRGSRRPNRNCPASTGRWRRGSRGGRWRCPRGSDGVRCRETTQRCRRRGQGQRRSRGSADDSCGGGIGILEKVYDTVSGRIRLRRQETLQPRRNIDDGGV